jgi:cytoskeletal protein CcmA (bactofilin family)
MNKAPGKPAETSHGSEPADGNTRGATSDRVAVATSVASGEMAANELYTQRSSTRNFSLPGVTMQGDFWFDHPVRLQGTVHGKVFSSSTVEVAPDARVIAEVKAQRLVVLGELHADPGYASVIEIAESARVAGQLSAQTLSAAEGALLNSFFSVRPTPEGQEQPESRLATA